eukprot:TRINITY_DN97537_c0_g1_i1.p1 TRINITY_DN97537_c0_g1~~TRINITY_DN97537_c0_g1_i1.p1  ORF type:complete len:102 (+),score=18.60 TRINITY_DN97537_c0_g1_i1:28-306(+)
MAPVVEQSSSLGGLTAVKSNGEALAVDFTNITTVGELRDRLSSAVEELPASIRLLAGEQEVTRRLDSKLDEHSFPGGVVTVVIREPLQAGFY